MQSILTSENTLNVEDYLELRNYTVSFTPEECDEVVSNERVMRDYVEMRKVFFTQETNIFGHNYSKTLLGPKMGKENAVDDVIQILKKTLTTRKAVLSFLPYGDEKVPCINLIHFLIRNNKLEITYFSRGQDIYRKFPCDAMCIIDFGKQVANAMQIELSLVTAVITSAHIYEKDIAESKNLINNCYSKKVILTGNKKKYADYAVQLSNHLVDLEISTCEIPEIQSVDPYDVVKYKAKYVYEKFGYPMWVDDVSFNLKTYPLFPGTYTKFWFKQLGVEGLKALLNGKTTEAEICCRLCSYDGVKYNIVEGVNRGYIDFERTIADPKMPLNSIFVGEGAMKHREEAIQRLIEWRGLTYEI